MSGWNPSGSSGNPYSGSGGQPYGAPLGPNPPAPQGPVARLLARGGDARRSLRDRLATGVGARRTPPGGRSGDRTAAGLRRRRIGARVIDLVVISLLYIPLIGYFANRIRERIAAAPWNFFKNAFAENTVGDVRAAVDAERAQTLQDTQDLLTWFAVACIALPAVYELLCHLVLGRSLGKVVWGLGVRGSDGLGRAGRVRGLLRASLFLGVPMLALGYGIRAGVRHEGFASFGWSLVFIAAVLGAWVMLLPGKRGLHDRLSGTAVVSNR
ncbi:RDD family protein [Streptomyces sp. P1-3]|uniref:RDD family protein n=1 Tax=Streptomyces sp. P1-3 TaxID=3421658 RepID=UPI003D36E52E